MLDATDVVEDVPTSQDAKMVIPMSLSLVAKKEKILQMEVTKLEKLLGQRNEMLCGLRESHEYLLTTNGRLQEKSRLRREKLVSLRTMLEADQEQNGKDKSGLCDAVGMNELEATAEKCGVLKDILLGLVDKHAGLEQRCMGLEEQTSRENVALNAKEERLNEVRTTLLLLHEDIRSTQWNFENDQNELTEEDKRLNTVSQNAQREAATVERVDTALRTEKAAVEDLRVTWQNYEGMIHEEHRLLAIANEDSRSEQRELCKRLESNGATCPADEEVSQTAKDLQVRLQHLNEEVTSAKFFKRELALRRKQEKDMLAITQSSIKAKDEQLTWLERQRVHLENEQNEAAKARTADEVAYRTSIEEHSAAIASLESQIKDAGKQVKTTERAIAASNKKVAAVNKKVAQKTKVLAEWKTKIEAKQNEVGKSAATQELVDTEVVSMQKVLEQEQHRLEHIQQLRTAQNMESEELRSSCAMLDAEVEQARKAIATTKSSITATQTAVKNRIDEVRDKFLSTFVVDEAENLIELLNKEIESWTTKDTDEADEAIAREATKLREKYDALATDTRKKYGKTLKRKEKQYIAKLEKLKKQAEEKQAKLTSISTDKPHTGNEGVMNRVSATSHQPEAGENKQNRANKEGPVVEKDNEADNQEFDQAWMERQSNKSVSNKEPIANKRLPKPNLTQRKAKGVPEQAPRSARRQLAPGLNLVTESPQTDNELTDMVTTNSTAVATAKVDKPVYSTFSQQRNVSPARGTRRPRLRRRTPAQKARWAGNTTASITPEVMAPVDNAHTLPSDQSNPAGMSSQGSLDSCGEDQVASCPAQGAGNTNLTKKTSANQGAATKPLLQKGRQRNKPAVKRSTSMKVSRKVNRISFGRSQRGGRTTDWSATDSFSFG